MGQRLELHELLKGVFPEEEEPHVYFQQPNGLAMQYPCILYKLSDEEPKHADNKLYGFTKRYQITVIDRNPDTILPIKLREFAMCRFSRFFTAENLNHYVYDLYF